MVRVVVASRELPCGMRRVACDVRGAVRRWEAVVSICNLPVHKKKSIKKRVGAKTK